MLTVCFSTPSGDSGYSNNACWQCIWKNTLCCILTMLLTVYFLTLSVDSVYSTTVFSQCLFQFFLLTVYCVTLFADSLFSNTPCWQCIYSHPACRYSIVQHSLLTMYILTLLADTLFSNTPCWQCIYFNPAWWHWPVEVTVQSGSAWGVSEELTWSLTFTLGTVTSHVGRPCQHWLRFPASRWPGPS